MILETKFGLFIAFLSSVIFTFLTPLIAFYSPIATIIIVVCAFVTADFITAICKSIKKAKNEDICKDLSWFKKQLCKIKVIKSSKIKRNTFKLAIYLMIIFLTYAAEIAVFATSIYIVNFVAFWLIFTEFISIAENCDYSLGTTMFTTIVKKIRKMFEDALIKKIENTKIEEEGEK